MSKYEWLEKRTLRAVDQLRLWDGNPRLSPEENHIHISDFVDDLLVDNSEKDQFFRLIDSISSNGFIPADPVVIWKSTDNDKYYVAEGNRRILVLKLLRHPEKAPNSIRAIIRKKATLIDRDSIEKIRVSVAPSFEDCLWYVNQRHASGGLQQRWSRLQQQRWVASLFDQYEGDVDKVMEITELKRGQLDFILSILKIRDLALISEIFDLLDDVEKQKVTSHRIPITIFERWFTNSKVKKTWGVELKPDEILLTKNKQSFYNAYLHWLKNVIRRDEPGVEIKINTRTIDANLDAILDNLPQVIDGPDQVVDICAEKVVNNEKNQGSNKTEEPNESMDSSPINENTPYKTEYKNPERPKLIVPTCQLSTSNFKLKALFEEFKVIPMDRYKNCLASSLRVFLDLAVAEYIEIEALEGKVKSECKRKFEETTLKQRLEFLKTNELQSKTPEYKVLEKLLNNTNDFSLDTLNSYVHGSKVHYIDRKFLNRFWDSLFPLMSFLLDIKEV
jgi:hypothetical protein